MNKKNAANAAAVIEIGATNVSLRAAQLYKGDISPLDFLEYPIRLDRDVFETGSVSFDSLRELSSVFDKFSSVLQSYNIQKTKVISCSILREAKNRSLVVDQLRVRNGLDILLLDDGQEKAYLYSEIASKLSGVDNLKKGNSVIAYVGPSSIGIAVFDGTKILSFQNISTGALRLHDILQDMQRDAEDFHTVVVDYLDTGLNRVAISEFPIVNLILTGSQIDLAAKLCGAKCSENIYQFGTERFSELYRSLRSLTPEGIGLRYGIDESSAALLYISLAIYQAMLRFCPKAETIYAPTADVSESVLRCMLTPKAETERAAFCRKSALACTETTAAHFGCNSVHSQYIRDCSCKIFDKLKRIHGLDPSKRLILELASLLHSCGSFVSDRQHNRCTFDLIKGMDLFGLSDSEVLETAFVAGSSTENLSLEENPDFARLGSREKLTVSKLSAIFRIANALDKSHRQKLRDIKLSLDEDRVLIKASASEDTLLEQWAFAESAQFFKEVFGLSPELAVKFELL